MAEERRKFVRSSMRLNLSYTVLGTKLFGKALTSDLSGGGLRFTVPYALKPGAQLDITMQLPERSEAVRFTAEVVWSKLVHEGTAERANQETEVGVKFVEIEPKVQALLRQYGTLYASPPGP